ncbi:MAG: 3-oxoadipate enol-lactonase [Candidatus Aldehydirespiratoraceae bacterium]|jgi:3-oxoadipate enol-lactonase
MPELSELSKIAGDGLTEDRVELVHGFGLRVVSKGWGEPMVWAHDAFSSIDDDDAVALVDFRQLAASRRVIRYDAVGHGRSAGVARPDDHTWESRGDDMLQLCERMRLPSVTVGGFSTGAATALWAAHLAPDRVNRLVLASLPNGWSWRAPAAGIQGLLGASAFAGVTEPLRFAARFAPLPQYQSGTISAYHAAQFRRITHTPRDRFIAALVGSARSNLPSAEELSTLKIPTLILAHRGDPIRPIGTARRVAEALPDAELVVADTDADVARWTDIIRAFVG